MAKKDGRTAAFLERAIRNSGRTQVQIAREAGLKHPNALSMMKLGRTKIPFNRIPALARACDVDALYFIRLALEEYHPELFKVLLETLGDSLTENEWKVVRSFRAGCRDTEVEVDIEVRLRLITMFQNIGEQQAKGKWPPRKGARHRARLRPRRRPG